DRGYGDCFVHRTGHSIDVSLHGSGPNLDNLESRDDRLLVEGVGFSVEPGIYVPGEIGIRSEVNVHWTAAGPEVTPARIQTDILLLLDDRRKRGTASRSRSRSRSTARSPPGAKKPSRSQPRAFRFRY